MEYDSVGFLVLCNICSRGRGTWRSVNMAMKNKTVVSRLYQRDWQPDEVWPILSFFIHFLQRLYGYSEMHDAQTYCYLQNQTQPDMRH